jgi:probable HAF family extracellular repeat protein
MTNYTSKSIVDPSATGITSAFGINNSGEIIGDYVVGNNVEGFSDSGGVFATLSYIPFGINNLGQIVGTIPKSYTYNNGINDLGQIVGFFYVNGMGFGTIAPIAIPGDPSAGSSGTAAESINNTGQVVGFYYDSNGHANGFLFSGGSFTTLDDPLGKLTYVTGINNEGQIVGTYYDANFVSHGFLYTGYAANNPSGGTYTTIADNVFFSGINDLGQIVGYTSSEGFVLSPSSVLSLFTTGADTVNFNDLTSTQQTAIQGGADIYHGIGGNDVVSLPNIANYNEIVAPGVTLGWTDASVFNTGSKLGDNYAVFGADGNYNLVEGAGTENITINGNGQNTIDAGSGSDTISISGNGNNKIFCATGSDTIVINGSGGNTIHLGTATATITLSGSNNNIDFDGHAGTANLFLQKGFQENINGFTSGDFIDLVNVSDATFSAAVTSAGVLNPGEVDLYQSGSKIGSLFFDASVDYTQLKPISDGTGGTEIVLDSAPGPQDPSGTQINWSFVHAWESDGEGVRGETELAPYISTGASGLTIAQGVDIGDQGNSGSLIRGLLNSWQSDPNIAFISTFINETHSQALASLVPSATVRGNPTSTSVSLTTTQANAITNAVETAIYNQLSQDYTAAAAQYGNGGWNTLSANRQTAIFDLAYNIGLHRNPPTHYGIEDLKLWTLLAQQDWTAAAARMAKTGGDPNRRQADANLLLDGLTASLPVIEPSRQVASNDTSYSFSVSDSSTQYALDPSGPYLTLIAGSGSPNITSIQLPDVDGTQYLVSYKTGSSWSAPQIAQPGDVLTFPGGGVEGLKVVMLDDNGNQAQGTPDFSFFLTFASAGNFSATVLSTSTTAMTDNGMTELGAGHVVTISVTTGATLTVTGTPTLELSNSEVASYTGGSGTNALTFSYKVQPGDDTDDLLVTGLNLPNGATIQDNAGNPLTDVAQDLGLEIHTVVPGIIGSVPTVTAGQQVALTNLYSISGSGITQYQVWLAESQAFGTVTDSNGNALPLRQLVSETSLNGLEYTGGATAGADYIWVRAYNGTWSNWAQTTVNDLGANPPPVLTGSSPTVGATQQVALTSLYSISGSGITQYQVWLAESQSFGTVTDSNGALPLEHAVTETSLNGISYTGGATAGTDYIWVRAYNGTWSNWVQTTFNDLGANPPPAVMGSQPVVAAGQQVALTSLYSISGSGITQYQVWLAETQSFGSVTDSNGNLPLEKVVSETSLNGINYTGGGTAGTDYIWVRAYNGAWSNWVQSVITDTGISASASLLTANNQVAGSNSPVTTIPEAAAVAGIATVTSVSAAFGSPSESQNGGTLPSDPSVFGKTTGPLAIAAAQPSLLGQANQNSTASIECKLVSDIVTDPPMIGTLNQNAYGPTQGQSSNDLSLIAFGAHQTLGYLDDNGNTNGTVSSNSGLPATNAALLVNYIASSFAAPSDELVGAVAGAEVGQTGSILTNPQHL